MTGADPAAAQSGASEERIARVERVGSLYEIEIVTGDPLPVRAMPMELHMGDAIFRRSLHPEGDMRRIVFFLTPAEFDSLSSGVEVWMAVGASEAVAQRWELGRWGDAR